MKKRRAKPLLSIWRWLAYNAYTYIGIKLEKLVTATQ
jgi:hypothetical protein